VAEPEGVDGGPGATAELAADLHKQVALGRAVLVVGAGVAVAASGLQQAASWRGLIESGIGWAEGHLPALPGAWGSYARGLLDLGWQGDLSLLLLVAEMVTDKLGGRDGAEYRAWLRETVGSLPLAEAALPRALAALDVPIVTTNYDDLIEQATGWATTTWADPYGVQRAFREGETTVVHLHGHWRTPASVVLGVRSYQEVLGDNKAQALQHIIAANKSLVFVGVGSGASDPNFVALRSWLAATFPGSEYRHYRLCLRGEETDVAREHRGERIVPVAYGTRHSDLLGFLRDLAPRAEKTALVSDPALRASGRVSNLQAEPFTNEFVGREQLLVSMRDSLRGAAGRPRALALRGVMGVGKTRTAKEYARRNAAEYEVIWWIPAEQEAATKQAITQLGARLGLPAVDDLQRACEAVVAKLQLLGRFLLIFDNVESLNDVRPYFPVHETGHILVTTRLGEQQLGSGVASMGVPPLPEDEALSLLAPFGSDMARPALEMLCSELGRLPLALVWARTTLAEGSAPRHILSQIRSQAELTDAGPIGASAPFASWSLAVKALQEISPDAVDLLSCCAFLGPGVIAAELLADPSARAALPERLRVISRKTEQLKDLQAKIGAAGLGDYQDGRLEVHRVTQHLMRSTIGESQRAQWDRVATELLLAAFPAHPANSSDWIKCEAYLEHALAVGACRLTATSPSIEKAVLLNRCGNYLFSRAMYSQSAVVFRRTAAIVRLLAGEGEQYATALSNLGLSRLNEGMVLAALRHCERAHALRSYLAADHPDLAASHNNLGCVSRELGDLEEAARHFAKAREIYARSRSRDPASYAMATNNLGVVRAQLRQPGAFSLLEEALQAEKEARGERNVEVAVTMNNLSIAHRASGDFEGSERILRQALDIVTELWSENHPDTAGILNNLGVTLRSQGRPAEALGYIETALSVEQAYYGEVHPEVASTLNNLGVTLRHMGRYAAALLTQEHALRIFEHVYQNDSHWRIAATHGGLGNMLRRLGDLDSAVLHHRRALEIESALYSVGDLELAGTHDNLGRALRHLGRLNEAAEHFERALTIKQANLREDDAEIAKTFDNLGVTRRYQGRFAEAAALHTMALAIRRKSEDLQGTHYSLVAYAFACRRTGDEQSATLALEEAVQIERLW
jgi:tetratricopeptide (TPR) repeat protein